MKHNYKTMYAVQITKMDRKENFITKYFEYFDNETKAINYVEIVNQTRDLLTNGQANNILFAEYVGEEVIEY